MRSSPSNATAEAEGFEEVRVGGLFAPHGIPYSNSRDHLLTPEAIDRLRQRGAAFFAYAGPLGRLHDEEPTVAEHLVQG